MGSLAGITVALIAGAGLWEHTSHPVGRKQVTLFNLATAATVVLGVLFFYVALLLLALVTSPVLVPTQLLEEGIGHAARVGGTPRVSARSSAA